MSQISEVAFLVNNCCNSYELRPPSFWDKVVSKRRNKR